ncbi:MAG TPA: hypothetical protein VG324_06735, partial [Blastocatellia bacterium]|nr:hypothetical protein [Blastocatellia bacterium]
LVSMGQWLAARGRFVCSPSYEFPPDSSIGIVKAGRDSTRKGGRLKDGPAPQFDMKIDLGVFQVAVRGNGTG